MGEKVPKLFVGKEPGVENGNQGSELRPTQNLWPSR